MGGFADNSAGSSVNATARSVVHGTARSLAAAAAPGLADLDRPWWAGLGLESVRLEREIDGVGTMLSCGLSEARKKYDHAGMGSSLAAYRSRLYACVYVAIKAEERMRTKHGARGRTHDRIAAGLSEPGGKAESPSRSITWLRGTSKAGIRGHELLSLIAGECLCPPVRRWLAEQVGAVMGVTVAFDLAVSASTHGGDPAGSLDAHCVDVFSAAGHLAAGVRDAMADGVLGDDERDRLRVRVRAVAAELAGLDASMG